MHITMKPAEDKGVGNNFEFQKTNVASKVARNRGLVLHSHPKPTPSKWDDAQKWLAGLSSGGNHNNGKSKPRNSNADDRRLLNSASQRERYSCSSADGLAMEDVGLSPVGLQEEGETKKIDCREPIWRANKPVEDSALAVRSVCVRDMGTEMSPFASQEPSRTATPLRASTPVIMSPVSSRSSTPGRHHGSQQTEIYQAKISERSNDMISVGIANVNVNGNSRSIKGSREVDDPKNTENNIIEQARNPNSLESRAAAWDEAERAKYMARYKREEVKIQAWENHEKRKAETEMRRNEVKAEKIKARAQEKMTNRLAAARRIAEEKRSSAEVKLNEQAVKTSERADYIRRTGHLPSSFFSFRRPSLCGMLTICHCRSKLCQKFSGN